MLSDGNLRLGKLWGGERKDGRKDGHMEIHPCVLQDISPLGPLSKKETSEKMMFHESRLCLFPPFPILVDSATIVRGNLREFPESRSSHHSQQIRIHALVESRAKGKLSHVSDRACEFPDGPSGHGPQRLQNTQRNQRLYGMGRNG